MKNLKQQRFIDISWKLIEAKILYYKFPCCVILSDSEYDSLEKEYLTLCKELKEPNTVQSMVGVDMSKPSVQTALVKLIKQEIINE